MNNKEHPIFKVCIDKQLKDTGQPNHPFFAKVGEYKKYYLFGLLLISVSITGNFPDPESKK